MTASVVRPVEWILRETAQAYVIRQRRCASASFVKQ
jgi:hypothetical protein